MAGHDSLPVDHIGHAASAQVDAADHIVEQVIFVGTHYIKNGLTIFFHRHSHGNAQTALEDRGCIDRQVICFF